MCPPSRRGKAPGPGRTLAHPGAPWRTLAHHRPMVQLHRPITHGGPMTTDRVLCRILAGESPTPEARS